MRTGKRRMNGDESFLARNQKRVFFALGSIVLVLLISNSITAYMYVGKGDETKTQRDQYLFLDPTRTVVERENRIVDFTELRKNLNDRYAHYPNNAISIYVEYFPTGESISVNKDYAFYPASLVKVPVSMAIMKKIERGEWKFDNKLVLMAGDANSGYGTLYKEPVGTQFTIKRLLEELLIHSDNTAHFIFLRNLNPHEVFSVHEHLGIEDAYSSSGSITVKNFATFIRSLYVASFLSGELANTLLEMLSKSPRELLAAGVPGDVLVSHKIGIFTEKNIYSDVGIVYLPDRTYLLGAVIWSKADNPQQETPRLMKEISEMVYNYIVSQ